MIDFILKMLLCLFLAAAVGFMVAWLLRSLGLQQLRDQTTDLKRNLAERDSLLLERDTKLKDIKSTLAARDSTISAHETRLGTLDTQITQLNHNRDSLSLELSGKDSTIKARDVSLASLTALVAAHELNIGTSQKASTDFNTKVAELQKTLTERDTMLRVRDDTLKSRELKIEELERNAATLSGKWAVDRDQLNVKITQLQTNQGGVGSAARIAELERQLKECGDSRRTLQEEVSAYKLNLTEQAKLPPRQFTQPPALIDDVKHIYGVGPNLEKLLNKLGVYLFKQVALWNEADIDFFDHQLTDFHGRIRREQWVRSATEEHYKKYGEWLGTGQPVITMPETNRD